MVAYAVRMAAGAIVVRQDAQAQSNWTKKEPRRSLLSVGRNALSSGLIRGEQIKRQLPKLALRLSELKSVVIDKKTDRRRKAA